MKGRNLVDREAQFDFILSHEIEMTREETSTINRAHRDFLAGRDVSPRDGAILSAVCKRGAK